jgi:hypothetical protein
MGFPPFKDPPKFGVFGWRFFTFIVYEMKAGATILRYGIFAEK